MTLNEESETDEALTKFLPSNNSLFSSTTRFSLMLILFTHKKAWFTKLQKLLKITSGRLNHHIGKLEARDYVKSQKVFFPTRPSTLIKITKHGEDSFRDYIYKLRDILNQL